MLPTEAAASLARAREIGIETFEAREHVAAAFAAVAWPAPPPAIMPRADELAPAQRALIETLAMEPAVSLAFMKIANVRLAAWVGLAPGGVLERIVEERGAPLWRVMRELEEAKDGSARAFLSTLSIADRLAAFGEVNLFGHEKPYRLAAESFFDYRDRELLESLRDEGREWAPTFADHLLTLDRMPKENVRWPVFLALVRAGIPIEPRWDVLVPLGFGAYRELTDEVVAAIPEARRAAAIIGSLGKVNPWAIGVPLLDRFPSVELVCALLGKPGGPPPALVEMIEPVARRHPVVAEVLAEALAGQAPAVSLAVARVLAPTRPAELTAIEQAQLARAGERWDGRVASVSDRLARANAETSFAGHIELRSLVDPEGRPAYDAWLYMGDSGTVFVAGTETVAAEIVQGGIECSDRALRAGLEKVLRRAKRG